MPFTTQYQPPADLIAQSAYIGGLGSYQRFLLQQQLQQQQLAQQNAYHQQALAQSAYGQNLHFLQAQMARRQQQQQFDVQNKLAQQKEANDLARDHALGLKADQDRAATNQRVAMQQQEANQRAAGVQAGQDRRQVIGNHMKWQDGQHAADAQMRQQGLMIKPEALQPLGEIDRAIQATVIDDTLKPGALAAKLDELRRRREELVATSQAPDPNAIPPAQKFDQETVVKPDGRYAINPKTGAWDRVGDPPPDPEEQWITKNKAHLIVVGEDENGKTTHRPMTLEEARSEYQKDLKRKDTEKQWANLTPEEQGQFQEMDKQALAQQQAAHQATVNAPAQAALRQFAKDHPKEAAAYGIHFSQPTPKIVFQGQPPPPPHQASAPVTTAAAPQHTPEPKTQAEVKKLAKGTQFRWTDGTLRMVP